MDQVPPTSGDDSEPENSTQNSLFVVAEEQLSASLGLNRTDLRAARLSFIRGADWQVRGHRVCWTEKAASAIALRQLPQNGVESRPEVSDALATPPLSPAEVLRVTAWNFPNSRVIHCRPDNNGHSTTPITVRVKDGRLFRQGMRILARPSPEGAAWEFLGNPDRPEAGARGPRWPGRW